MPLARTWIAAAALLISGAARAEPPFIDYDWDKTDDDPETCVYSGELMLKELGFAASKSTGNTEALGRKGDYKAIVACLPGIRLYIVAGPAYKEAKDLSAKIKQGLQPK
ncbi:MAG: hypothetical protein U1F68_04020 [Gammaproteobacteria bacterium]